MQHPYSNVRGNAKDDLSPPKYHYTHPPPNAIPTPHFEIYRGAIQRMFDRTGEFAGMPPLDSQLKEDLVEYLTVEEESEHDDGSVNVQVGTQIPSAGRRPAHSSIPAGLGSQVPSITSNQSTATGSSRRSARSTALTYPTTFTPEERKELMMTNTVPELRIYQRKYAVEFFTSMVPSLALYRILEEGAGRRTKGSEAERIQHFDRDPWVTNVQPHQAICIGCERAVRWVPTSYDFSKWLCHRNWCNDVYEKWCLKNGITSDIYQNLYRY
ncbi:hypothetical protein CYLTODRAFT_484179 [Cylindrobasidium torrendii FP15055 ss-10]|uniref:Uncharacterized protein n=1 Tax=Cylindrobasidium torrendii FP15055 ss-10 TaxID=1314674 RepID=A0A0D7BA43_9AGAR|nr:hypothetical protein CYLTODRAFT_484179 [Cylindrobasidium torrendii FP15055 ss-10]